MPLKSCLLSKIQVAIAHSTTFLDKKLTTNKDLEQEMVLMRVKGGAVVDPDSGLEDRASVARDSKGRALSAVLGMVDLVKGYNSYYR